MERGALTHSDYTVGWICALPKELAAATAMLDEHHTDLPKPASDINAYTLGSIGGHNVVLCCLPKGMIGNVPAATVASHLVTTFPFIKLGLLVGIGGGVPSNKVRLGDVVVSTASGIFPGVVKWDSGKAFGNGKFERTGSLNNPPQALLAALSKLITRHDLVGSAIPQYLEQVKEKWPKLAATSLRTDSLKDILFKASYSHVVRPKGEEDEDEEEESCHLCDKSMTVKRKPREMVIHYGLIASGDKLVKDAKIRNQLNEDLGGHVLCIEMEAAGIMNNFSCLVVRGICDYADTHKNKDWQEHAAIVAAAFAKELLHYVQASDIETERPMKELVEIVHSIKSTVSKTHEDVSQVKSEQVKIRDERILYWLSTLEYGLQQSQILKLRESGTGNWFFSTEQFKTWSSISKQALFCEGIPGAGKTILTSIVIDHLTSKYQTHPSIGIAYIYCNYQRQNEQTVDQLLASLLKQLSGKWPSLPQDVVDLHDTHTKRRTRPGVEDIVTSLDRAVLGHSQIFLLIDALDEYGATGDSKIRFLQQISRLRQQFKFNVFMTSRFDSSVTSQIEKLFEGVMRIEIRADREDIQTYVRCKLDILPPTVYEGSDLQNDIVDGIADSVDGMFLLAQLYVNLLSYQDSETQIRLQLEAFASRKGYGEDGRIAALSIAYKETMDRINQQHSKQVALAKQVLLWLTHARRELRVEELRHALAASSVQRQVSAADLPYHEKIVAVCTGLVIIDERRQTIGLAHYTVQEYFSKNPDELYPLSEKDIAMSCLGYISYIPVSEDVEGWRECDRLRGSFPFYSYAVKHWGDHVLQSSVPDDELISLSSKSAYVAQSFWCTMKEHGRSMVSGPVNMLYPAAFFGLTSFLSKLLEIGVGVDGYGGSMKTPLAYAAEYGNIAAVELLLKAGANPNFLFTVTEGNIWVRRTPLSYAAERGHTIITRILLEGNAAPDLHETEDPFCSFKPMSCALREGHEDVVRLLLDWGAEDIQFDFIQAAESGDEAVVRLLLEAGAGVNYQSPPDSGECVGDGGITAISFAARNGHQAVIRLLLEEGADVTLKDQLGRIPLSLAACNNDLVSFDLLLEASEGGLDSADYGGDTALCYASMSGNESFVSLLLDRGSDPNPKLESEGEPLKGCTPLWYASEGGYTSIVQLLLAKGADPDARSQRTTWHQGRTPIALAAQKGHIDIVGLLLDQGARLDYETITGDDIGKTALSFAISSNNQAIAELLLQGRANPEPPGSIGNPDASPFSWAARRGSERIERMLLEAGVTQIDLPDDRGRTPLSYMAANGHEENIRILLQRGPNTDSESNGGVFGGRTPLSFAAEYGHNSIVQLLLEHGANAGPTCTDNCGQGRISIPFPLEAVRNGLGRYFQLLFEHTDSDAIAPANHQGLTPLHFAAENGHGTIVQLLLGRGVDPNASPCLCLCRGNETPLALAAKSGHDAVVCLLFQSGAHIDPKDDRGRTPLSTVAEKNDCEDMIRLLIKSGANIHSKDFEGKTPLAYAVQKQQEENTRLLVQGGADIHAEDNQGETPLSLSKAFPSIEKILLNQAQTLSQFKRRKVNG